MGTANGGWFRRHFFWKWTLNLVIALNHQDQMVNLVIDLSCENGVSYFLHLGGVHRLSIYHFCGAHSLFHSWHREEYTFRGCRDRDSRRGHRPRWPAPSSTEMTNDEVWAIVWCYIRRLFRARKGNAQFFSLMHLPHCGRPSRDLLETSTYLLKNLISSKQYINSSKTSNWSLTSWSNEGRDQLLVLREIMFKFWSSPEGLKARQECKARVCF